MGGLKYPGYTTITTPAVRLKHCNTCSVSSYPPPPPQYNRFLDLLAIFIHWFYDNICGVLLVLRSHKNAIYLLVKYFPRPVRFNIPTVFYLKVLSERPAAVTDYVDADLGQNLIWSDLIGNKEAVRFDIPTHLPSYPTHPRVRPYKLFYYEGGCKKIYGIFYIFNLCVSYGEFLNG